MFDIKKIEAEAKKELADEQSKDAKNKIKKKVREIEQARRIVRNLEGEYEVLLRDIGD